MRPPAFVSRGLYGFILQEAGSLAVVAAGLTAAVGLLRALLVFLMGEGADALMNGSGLGLMPFVFVAALAALAVFLILSLWRTVRVTEAVATNPTVRIAAKVHTADVADVDRIGRERIRNALTRDTTSLANSALLALNAVQAASFLAALWLFLLAASPLAGVLVAGLVYAGTVSYGVLVKRQRAAAQAADDAENAYGSALTDALWGFKEMRLNTGKRRDLIDNFMLPRIWQTAENRSIAGLYGTRVAAQMFIYHFVATALVVLIIAQFDPGMPVWTCAMLLAFARPNVMELRAYQPILVTAGVAANRLRDLEQAFPRTEDTGVAPALASFGRLALTGITHTHVTETGTPVFTTGPIDLHIDAGTTVFVVGGNGSGKSTLLRLLCGLYRPESGDILVDGRPVSSARLRSLFAPVFFDFHLFQAFYGLDDIDRSQAAELLGTFDLTDTVTISDQAFSRVDLSSGQRRRLALIAALLERRPILLIDEWTADQAPEFRSHFFLTLLPTLKQRGITVIAAVHDDRYFHCADLLVEMELGKIRRVSRPHDRTDSPDTTPEEPAPR